MKFDFDKTIDFEGINSEKWNYIKDKFGRDDIIPMWIADMDFETVPEISQAIRNRAEKGVFGYTKNSDNYNKSLIEWFDKRHDWKIDKEWIVQSSGVINGIHLALKSISSEEYGVVIQPPIYYPFYRIIKKCGLKTLINPLKLIDNKYHIDFIELEKIFITEKPKVFLMCNPHNPTGKVLSKDDLIRLGELCIKYDVLIISDEIHADLVYEPHKHIPIASISDSFADHIITCTAPSKTFNLAGLYTSNIIIKNNDLRENFIRFQESLGLHSFNIFGSIACENGYRYGAEWLDSLLEYLSENRTYIADFINKNIPSIDFIEPEGTYFFWLNFNKLGLKNADLEVLLVEKAGLWLNQGYIFGHEGNGFASMNIACPKSTIIEALNRLEKVINGLNK